MKSTAPLFLQVMKRKVSPTSSNSDPGGLLLADQCFLAKAGKHGLLHWEIRFSYWALGFLQLMNNLDFKQAVQEIAEAVKFLKGEGSPKVQPDFVFLLSCSNFSFSPFFHLSHSFFIFFPVVFIFFVSPTFSPPSRNHAGFAHKITLASF